MFDPTISLDVKPPQLTPMADLLYAGARAKQAQQEIGLQQQQRDLNIERIAQEKQLTRKTELENQSRELAQKSQESYLKAVADANGDPDKMEAALKNAPLTPEHRIAANQHIAQEKERLAKATTEQQELEAKDKEEIGQGIRSVRALPEDQRLPAWQAVVGQAASKKNPITGVPYVTPGQVNVDQVPTTDQLTAIERVLRGSKAFDAHNAADEKDRKLVEADATKRLGDIHNETAAAFDGVNSGPGFEDTLQKLAAQDANHAEYAKRFLTSLPTNTPEALKSSLKIINRRAMTAEQRQKADEVENKGVADPKTLVELEIAAADPTISEAKKQQYGRAIALHKENRVTPNNQGVQDRFDQREADKLRVEADKDRDKVHDLQAKEQDKWKQVTAYEKAAQAKNGDPVVDPSHTTNQSLKMTDELRAQYLGTAAAARKEAAAHNQAQDQILAQHQWGDYAPGKSKATAAASPASGAAAAPPAASASVAKPAVAPQIDPSIKEKSGYRVDGEYETKDGRKFKLKGFTKDGKMIPDFK